MFNLLACLTLLILSPLWAQNHLGIHLSQDGIESILKLGLKPYQVVGGNLFSLPKRTQKITLSNKKLSTNPIVKALSNISDIDLTRDLDFYLEYNPIDISGSYDEKSLKFEIISEGINGFDLKMSLRLRDIRIFSSKISLCEFLKNKSSSCDKDALNIDFINSEIKTQRGQTINLEAYISVKMLKGVMKLSLKEVKTNLKGRSAPNLQINLEDVVVPPVSITVDDQTVELDTKGVRAQILNQRKFLSDSLLEYAAEYIAIDFVKWTNTYLSHRGYEGKYSYNFEKFKLKKVDYLADLRKTPILVPDRLTIRNNKIDEANRLNGFVSDKEIVEELKKELNKLIKFAKLDISLSEMRLSHEEGLEIYADNIKAILNGSSISIKDNIWNSQYLLSDANFSRNPFSSTQPSHMSVVISEPIINGVFSLFSKTGLFQGLFEEFSGKSGLELKNVQIHLRDDKPTLIGQLIIDLNSSDMGWLKRKFVLWLERDRKGVINIPLELELKPTIIKVAGKSYLKLKVGSPFNIDKTNFKNSFNYPSNINEVSSMVRKGVIDELDIGLFSIVDKEFQIDITQYLTQSGVSFEIKNLSSFEGQFLRVDLNVKDINIKNIINNAGKK